MVAKNLKLFPAPKGAIVRVKNCINMNSWKHYIFRETDFFVTRVACTYKFLQTLKNEQNYKFSHTALSIQFESVQSHNILGNSVILCMFYTRETNPFEMQAHGRVVWRNKKEIKNLTSASVRPLIYYRLFTWYLQFSYFMNGAYNYKCTNTNKSDLQTLFFNSCECLMLISHSKIWNLTKDISTCFLCPLIHMLWQYPERQAIIEFTFRCILAE